MSDNKEELRERLKKKLQAALIKKTAAENAVRRIESQIDNIDSFFEKKSNKKEKPEKKESLFGF